VGVLSKCATVGCAPPVDLLDVPTGPTDRSAVHRVIDGVLVFATQPVPVVKSAGVGEPGIRPPLRDVPPALRDIGYPRGDVVVDVGGGALLFGAPCSCLVHLGHLPDVVRAEQGGEIGELRGR
jgi:hypothetical protein